ncbi:sensor histidine kinase [Terriglobus albidus]|uniref:sensor histidine kinase n=1 Tax=Terriglobus albidus TaxID=1592106 RepID=UPI0021E0F14B|nr:ATP-binding protein [Terriglobus albidus]
MRTFFLQLFFSFWVSTIVIFVAATIFSPMNAPRTPEELQAILGMSTEQLTQFILSDYRAHGCSAPAISNSHFILADGNGETLCSRPIDEEGRSLLHKGIEAQKVLGQRSGKEWLQIWPVILESGEKWYLLLRAPAGQLRLFPPFPKSALPISILVTFLFAYLLTRPLRALSKAFRRFSAGDLGARLPVSGTSRWGRFDSADVRTLMLDFNRMAERVSELIDAQKLLVRDISHELRSPLTRLRLALELAREDNLLDQASFDRMARQTDKVNDLIREILTLSLLESTGELPRSESFSMRTLIEELLPDVNFEAAARSCTIRLSSQAEAGVNVTGQKEMLQRAVENVLRNAIRYSPSGGVIDVELSLGEDGGTEMSGVHHQWLCVSIRDMGPGIPVEHLTQIFRPFYRVDLARSESSGGFGVGLAIAERAVHLHGGKIVAKNRATGGLDVQIWMPRSEARSASETTPV